MSRAPSDIRVLVAEELMASEELWLASPESLRQEAAAMLSALLTDLSQVSHLSVALSHAALERLRCNPGLPSGVLPIVIPISRHSCWLESGLLTPADYDATLVIAPESDGLLCRRLSFLQSDDWRAVLNLNLSSGLAATFSDKLSTFRWLSDLGFLTPVTCTAHEFRSFFNSSISRQNQDWILKPRDGVGSDGVTRLNTVELEATLDAISSSEMENLIVQPYVAGTACSFGMIGGGSVRPPIVLPTVHQVIEQSGRALKYRGGSFPCKPEIEQAVRSVANRLASALEHFSGYVGVDVVVENTHDGKPTVFIIEVNPRLSFSYLGYRRATQHNLAALILQLPDATVPAWDSLTIHF